MRNGSREAHRRRLGSRRAGDTVIRGNYAALSEITAEGAGVLIAGQKIGQALSVSDRVYCLKES